MSGANTQGPPDRLTPIAGDQPIGNVDENGVVRPTQYFFQMMQRILSYLGQPGQGTATGAPNTNLTVSEQLTYLMNAVDQAQFGPGAAAIGLDGRVSTIERLLRRLPWYTPKHPRSPAPDFVIPGTPAKPAVIFRTPNGPLQRVPYQWFPAAPTPPTAGGSGTVTDVATSGAGISGGPITTTGTLTVEWNAGEVTGLNADTLAINADTLEVVGVVGNVSGSPAPAGIIGEVIEGTTTGADDTCTISIASPAVITVGAGHGSLGIFPVVFFTTGALPTGLSSNTLYWATYINATTFHVSTTIANAVAGTYIPTSGTQSGTQSAVLNAPVTGSNQDVAAIILTPGQWGIWGGLSWISSSGTSTNSSIWLNNVSATRPTTDLTAVDSLLNSQQTFGFNQAGIYLERNVSANTPIYLSGIIAGTSGWGVYGQIIARRVG